MRRDHSDIISLPNTAVDSARVGDARRSHGQGVHCDKRFDDKNNSRTINIGILIEKIHGRRRQRERERGQYGSRKTSTKILRQAK